MHHLKKPRNANPNEHESRKRETDDILRLFDRWAIRWVLGGVGLYLLYEFATAFMN